MEGWIGKSGRWGRRRKQLVNDLKETRRYWKLKYLTLWRTGFGRCYETILWQTKEWMITYHPTLHNVSYWRCRKYSCSLYNSVVFEWVKWCVMLCCHGYRLSVVTIELSLFLFLMIFPTTIGRCEALKEVSVLRSASQCLTLPIKSIKLSLKTFSVLWL
jgi:hypothetical protein